MNRFETVVEKGFGSCGYRGREVRSEAGGKKRKTGSLRRPAKEGSERGAAVSFEAFKRRKIVLRLTSNSRPNDEDASVLGIA